MLVDITPVSGSDKFFGFGGLAVDMQNPGTIMVASLNSWYPDQLIWRSKDSGKTYTPLWEWSSYPSMNKHYTYSDSLAPWLGPDYTYTGTDIKQIGWMIESLEINPFDSNHWVSKVQFDDLQRLTSYSSFTALVQQCTAAMT
jgi:xyloglucan-specific exo-beta-1,4-glucanase